jgi:hypothetical protein
LSEHAEGPDAASWSHPTLTGPEWDQLWANANRLLTHPRGDVLG